MRGARAAWWRLGWRRPAPPSCWWRRVGTEGSCSSRLCCLLCCSYLTEVPAAVGATLGGPLDWSFLTKPDGRACLGMRGGRCLWHGSSKLDYSNIRLTSAAGRVVGGGSTINGMLYVRGDKEDYDNWERRGNPDWGWRHVLPYFTS